MFHCRFGWQASVSNLFPNFLQGYTKYLIALRASDGLFNLLRYIGTRF